MDKIVPMHLAQAGLFFSRKWNAQDPTLASSPRKQLLGAQETALDRHHLCETSMRCSSWVSHEEDKYTRCKMTRYRCGVQDAHQPST